MQFLAVTTLYVLTPFVLLFVLPGWTSRIVVGALIVGLTAVLAFGPTATAPFLLALIAAGVVSGLVTGGIDVALRERDASWHARAVTFAAGMVACAPLWLATLFVLTMVTTLGR